MHGDTMFYNTVRFMIYQFVSAIFVVCKHTDILMVVIFSQGHHRQLDVFQNLKLV